MSVEAGTRMLGSMLESRRQIMSPKNPRDKATIVSIFPRDIANEDKPTMTPGRFNIPAGSFEKPSITVIGPSSWWRDLDPDQPMIESVVAANVVADSIINDYQNGLLGCIPGVQGPGLFIINDEIGSHLTVITNYKNKLEEVREKQRKWYLELVNLADGLWARSNNNPLAIWDVMRMAARELGIENKDWLKNIQKAEMVRCFACGNLRDPNYPVCMSCKVVDQKHPLAANLKFVQ